MAYEFIDSACFSHKGVTKDWQPEWACDRYFIGGKMFAMAGGDKNGARIFTVKLEPAHSELLRAQYPGDIVPGYYMNKLHWSSLYLTGHVPEAVVLDMIDSAYAVTLRSLPKKQQAEISAL